MSDSEGLPVEICEEDIFDHPYLNYPPESLIAMAYGDPKAAEVLGRNILRFTPHQDHEKRQMGAWVWSRAAALTSDPEVLYEAAATAFESLGEQREGEYRINSESIEDYTIYMVAYQMLGGKSKSDPYRRYKNSRLGLEPNVKKIESNAKALAMNLADIQLSVTGETNFKERLNANI